MQCSFITIRPIWNELQFLLIKYLNLEKLENFVKVVYFLHLYSYFSSGKYCTCEAESYFYPKIVISCSIIRPTQSWSRSRDISVHREVWPNFKLLSIQLLNNVFHCKLLRERCPFIKYCWISFPLKNNCRRNIIGHFFLNAPPRTKWNCLGISLVRSMLSSSLIWGFTVPSVIEFISCWRGHRDAWNRIVEIYERKWNGIETNEWKELEKRWKDRDESKNGRKEDNYCNERSTFHKLPFP